MTGHSRPDAYGDAWAAVYDEEHAHLADVGETVDRIVELSAGGPVLEFGVGTGRIAIALAAHGLHVVGVDASEKMLDQLHAKDRGEDPAIQTVLGDMAEVRLEQRFALVLLAFNTLFNLTSQDAQVACVRNAADHLLPGGRLVVEAFVPDPARFDDGQAVRAERVEHTSAHLSIERHDPTTQRVDSGHLRVGPAGVQLLPVSIRYVWPSELDLMARLAGLVREHRWGGWDRSPYTAASTSHVSVYRAP